MDRLALYRSSFDILDPLFMISSPLQHTFLNYALHLFDGSCICHCYGGGHRPPPDPAYLYMFMPRQQADLGCPRIVVRLVREAGVVSLNFVWQRSSEMHHSYDSLLCLTVASERLQAVARQNWSNSFLSSLGVSQAN